MMVGPLKDPEGPAESLAPFNMRQSKPMRPKVMEPSVGLSSLWFAGRYHCEAHCVWECRSLLWEEERGGRAHASVVGLCEAVQK